MLGSVLGFKAGPTKNDKAFKTMFPYEAEPWRGFQGPSYEGKKVTTPVVPDTKFAVVVKSLACTDGGIVFGTENAAAGKTVEYSAAGVTPWTTNPNQRIEQELFWDNNSGGTLNIKARYVGEPDSEVSTQYDFRKQCGRARIASEPANAPTSFAINVLGNPTNKDVVAFDLRGNGWRSDGDRSFPTPAAVC